MKSKTIKKNILLSVFAQIISFIVSFLLNLIVPKHIDLISYANWQTYILYVGYVGILHFGLLDGLLLRYSHLDYDELNKPLIRSQFKVLLIFTSSLMLLTICFAAIFAEPSNKPIYYLVAVGMLIKNLYTYSSYSFQITNRIEKYVFLVISDRIIYGLFVTILLIGGINNFWLYCVADLFSDLIGILICSFFNKGLYFGYSVGLSEAIQETINNIKGGFLLLLANWSAVLLIGSGKMIIQLHWDQLVFGKVSFAFSLSNIFITMVTAISVVLFPSMKRMDLEELPLLYIRTRKLLVPLLLASMILYFPCIRIVQSYIPKYYESLHYLGLILPSILPLSVVSLLTNNYFKAYRKERDMLIINVLSVVIAIVLFSLMAYVFESLEMLLLAIVFVCVIRAYLSEKSIAKLLNFKINVSYVIELVVIISFVYLTFLNNITLGFAIYGIIFLLFLFLNRVISTNKQIETIERR